MTDLSLEGAEAASVCSAGRVLLNLWGCTVSAEEPTASLGSVCCHVIGLDHWLDSKNGNPKSPYYLLSLLFLAYGKCGK